MALAVQGKRLTFGRAGQARVAVTVLWVWKYGIFIRGRGKFWKRITGNAWNATELCASKTVKVPLCVFCHTHARTHTQNLNLQAWSRPRGILSAAPPPGPHPHRLPSRWEEASCGQLMRGAEPGRGGAGTWELASSTHRCCLLVVVGVTERSCPRAAHDPFSNVLGRLSLEDAPATGRSEGLWRGCLGRGEGEPGSHPPTRH